MLFFVFFCVRRVAGVFALFCSVLPSHPVAGGLASLYVPLGYPWQALALLACCGFVAGVFTLSRVAVCRCCRFCRFVCVCDCVAVCVSLQAWRPLTLSRFRVACIPVRLSGFRTSVRLSSFEQVFETSVLMPFWVSLAEFPTESEPNFDSVALCV